MDFNNSTWDNEVIYHEGHEVHEEELRKSKI